MEDFRSISQSQYFSIGWAADFIPNITFPNEGPSLPHGKAAGADDGLISCALALQDVTIVYAKTLRAGVLCIAPIERPVILSARVSESCNLRWGEGESLAIGASEVSFGVVGAPAQIRLPAAEATFVLAPRPLQADRGPPASHLSAKAHPALEVLMAQASILAGRKLTPPVAQVCEASLRGLLAVALADYSREWHPTGSADALYREILLDISANCGRHDYGLSQVAQRHRINVRTLQKLFQKHGTTLKEHLTSCRLQLAIGSLRNPANADKKVSDIAFEAGFNDVATFNRLFRKRFGRSPTAFRAGPAVARETMAD